MPTKHPTIKAHPQAPDGSSASGAPASIADLLQDRIVAIEGGLDPAAREQVSNVLRKIQEMSGGLDAIVDPWVGSWEDFDDILDPWVVTMCWAIVEAMRQGVTTEEAAMLAGYYEKED